MTVARLDMHNQALIPCIVDEPELLQLMILLLVVRYNDPPNKSAIVILHLFFV